MVAAGKVDFPLRNIWLAANLRTIACSASRYVPRYGPDLGTLACACGSLSRADAKWEHFDWQPWIPVGDERTSR